MRLAMDKAINKAGGTAVLRASWYAEWQPSLHEAVGKYWQQRTRLTGCVPHLPIARDVWDLLRGMEGHYGGCWTALRRMRLWCWQGDHHASSWP